MSRSLGQAALGQLAAVSAHSAADSVEIAARSLSLWGKFLGLLAATEEPTCLHALWEEQKTVVTSITHIHIRLSEPSKQSFNTLYK